MTAPFLGWLNVSNNLLSVVNPTYSVEQNGLASDNTAPLFSIKDHFVALKGNIYTKEDESTPLTAEALLESYLSQGPQCLSQFSGHFIFAIISNQKNEVFIARDKIGTNALYFTLVGNGLAFSDQCYHLKSCLTEKTSISNQTIYNYFYFHYIPSPDTIYNELAALEPGHYALFRKGKIKTIPYWTAQFTHLDDRTFKDKANHLKSLLNQSIQQRSEHTETGCFLSGGIDSSTILGLMSHQGKKSVKAFSIGFDAERFNEMEYAELAAKKFKAEHIKYFVTPQDIIEGLPKLMQRLDQPFGNASILPTYFCAKIAKESGVDCLLAGDGGDELFGGNTRYAEQLMFARYHQIPKQLRLGVLEPLAKWLPNPARPNIISKFKSYIHQAHLPMPDRQERYNLLGRIGADNIFTPNFLQDIDQAQPLLLLKMHYAEANADSMLSKMLSLDLKFTLADNDLRKVASACDLANIKVAFPFLDDQLIRFALRLPDFNKVNGSELRYFFKKAMADLLPKQIISKSKHGFGLPFGIWLTQHADLQAFIYDHLQMLKQRYIVQPRFIDELTQTLIKQHPSYYGVMAWTLVTFEIWMQMHSPNPVTPNSIRAAKTRTLIKNEVA